MLRAALRPILYSDVCDILESMRKRAKSLHKPEAVAQCERGAKTPGGPALRLLT
jgi:hypothetical protein